MSQPGQYDPIIPGPHGLEVTDADETRAARAGMT